MNQQLAEAVRAVKPNFELDFGSETDAKIINFPVRAETEPVDLETHIGLAKSGLTLIIGQGRGTMGPDGRGLSPKLMPGGCRRQV